MTDIEYLQKYLDKSNLENGIKRLENGEPVQYIVGNVDFYDLNLNVNENVLIPRFETEELVFRLINYIKKNLGENVRILDIGTGSGCIALTLKHKLEHSIVDASDVSLFALEVAKSNALKNSLDVNFIESDILKNITSTYDVIVSNPPYISYDEEIMDIVKNNEPHLALYADNNGLYFYREILSNAKKYLNKKNIIAFEIGEKQGSDIKKIALEYFPNSTVKIEKDLYNRDRYVFIFNEINDII